MKTWPGGDLEGPWTCTRKLDGVQAIYRGGKPISRRGKPLYNLPRMPDGVYEVYLGSWERTVSAVRTLVAAVIPREHLYRIDHKLDERLVIHTFLSGVKAPMVKRLLRRELARGGEGLVLHPFVLGRDDREPLKVKPVETYDVKVVGMIAGRGKHEGRMGALVTPMGDVGTGFTDADRARRSWVGKTIEVAALGLTPGGKFRHPRFVRVRFDK